MTQRFYTRSVGQRRDPPWPAVPSMIDEYVTMCDKRLRRLLAGSSTTKSSPIFGKVLEGQLTAAYSASAPVHHRHHL